MTLIRRGDYHQVDIRMRRRGFGGTDLDMGKVRQHDFPPA
jgi:hypothetical protein